MVVGVLVLVHSVPATFVTVPIVYNRMVPEGLRSVGAVHIYSSELHVCLLLLCSKYSRCM